jgi:hypothetical protein
VLPSEQRLAAPEPEITRLIVGVEQPPDEPDRLPLADLTEHDAPGETLASVHAEKGCASSGAQGQLTPREIRHQLVAGA